MLFKLILLFSIVGFIMSTTCSSQENETSNPLNVVNRFLKYCEKILNKQLMASVNYVRDLQISIVHYQNSI